MIRNWNRSTDSGAIHVLGDGHVIAYGFGPEIIQVLAYPLSADSFVKIELPEINECVSERVKGTAIWKHTLKNGTVITDMVDVAAHCFHRQIRGTEKIKMLITFDEQFLLKNAPEADTLLEAHTDNGAKLYIYHVDITVDRYFLVTGDAKIVSSDNGTYEVTVKNGDIYASDSAESIEKCKSTPFADSVKAVTEYWKEFLKEMKPLSDENKEIAENVGIMIKSQQASDGGVLAGYNYHLAYVRDQYGTARGLVAMGFLKEAEAIAYFYKKCFDEYGTVHNAASVDHHGIFHVHENDNVEITGYLAIISLIIYEANKSEAFLNDMLPLVRWCIERQIGELKNGMLSFNGDETYIAGGFLPRYAMLDGSSEATMLLHESITRYYRITGDDRYNGAANEIEKTYVNNFIRNGRLMTNVPERAEIKEYPLTRNGVCEACSDYIVPLFLNENGRYVCEKCIKKAPLKAREMGSLELAASKLALIYNGSDLVPEDIMRKYLDEMLQMLKEKGQMPSGCEGGSSLGYDYGTFLYALVKLNHPAKDEIKRLTVSVLDETGVWCEYYKNGKPYNTRCRPWESAINTEALIAWEEAR
ncbi:MAG: hypothetical protein IKM06_00455 [Clostridia bacterium]|nr:hypothetical protein [Clostridia bacterium]